MSKTLKIFKEKPEVITPTYATERSACFDIHAYLKNGSRVKMWYPDNLKDEITVQPVSIGSIGTVTDHIMIGSGERVLIPTGLIFGIPEGYSLRLHPRSGNAVKGGITLINCEGVVDEDYPEQTFIAVINMSDIPYVVYDGDRIAQGEIVPVEQVVFEETESNPVKRTDRKSGLGSTGK